MVALDFWSLVTGVFSSSLGILLGSWRKETWDLSFGIGGLVWAQSRKRQ